MEHRHVNKRNPFSVRNPLKTVSAMVTYGGATYINLLFRKIDSVALLGKVLGYFVMCVGMTFKMADGLCGGAT